MAAVPLICLLAAEQAQFMKREQQSAVPEMLPRTMDRQFSPRVGARLVEVQEEQTVSFNPCGLWVHYPPQVSVVQAGNLLASLLSQWQVQCPPRWSVAHMLGVEWGVSPDNFRATRRLDVALCLMIAIQWFLIGSFPLSRSRRWWAEPGAFITASTAVAACIAIIPVVDGLARLPALVAGLAWLWWLGLLIWIPVRLACQSTLGGLRRLSN